MRDSKAREAIKLLSRDVSILCGGIYTTDLDGNHAIISEDLLKKVRKEIDEKPELLKSEQTREHIHSEKEGSHNQVAMFSRMTMLSGRCFVCKSTCDSKYVRIYCYDQNNSFYFHPECFRKFLTSVNLEPVTINVTDKL
jgi:hypothetical protein